MSTAHIIASKMLRDLARQRPGRTITVYLCDDGTVGAVWGCRTAPEGTVRIINWDHIRADGSTRLVDLHRWIAASVAGLLEEGRCDWA